MLGNRVFRSFAAVFLLLFLSNDFSSGTETDVFCLRSIKSSLQDPNNYLLSWDFTNTSQGSICKFAGIICWNPDENKVLSIGLSNMGLKGQFPRGIENCTSLTHLDLSKNDLSGGIPSDISQIISYVITLDLSSNAFTGPITESLANCSYLNALRLDHNQLSGEIPPELGLFSRLTIFNVANNLLSGPVPRFENSMVSATYANNPGLCGGISLKRCSVTKSQTWVIGVRVFWVSFLTFFVGYFLFQWFLKSKCYVNNKPSSVRRR